MSKKRDEDFIKRDTLLESIDFHDKINMFCELTVLDNEAAVESFFVNR